MLPAPRRLRAPGAGAVAPPAHPRSPRAPSVLAPGGFAALARGPPGSRPRAVGTALGPGNRDAKDERPGLEPRATSARPTREAGSSVRHAASNGRLRATQKPVPHEHVGFSNEFGPHVFQIISYLFKNRFPEVTASPVLTLSHSERSAGWGQVAFRGMIGTGPVCSKAGTWDLIDSPLGKPDVRDVGPGGPSAQALWTPAEAAAMRSLVTRPHCGAGRGPCSPTSSPGHSLPVWDRHCYCLSHHPWSPLTVTMGHSCRAPRQPFLITHRQPRRLAHTDR